MVRRVLVLLLLIVGLALIVAPALVAVHALLRGDLESAWRAIAPILLIPLGFLLVGLIRSFPARGQDTRRPRP